LSSKRAVLTTIKKTIKIIGCRRKQRNYLTKLSKHKIKKISQLINKKDGDGLTGENKKFKILVNK